MVTDTGRVASKWSREVNQDEALFYCSHRLDHVHLQDLKSMSTWNHSALRRVSSPEEAGPPTALR